MKKLAVLIILAILATVMPVIAGAPTEYEIPEPGTKINGFKVVDVTNWEQYATDVVKLEHEKTGSVLYWLANDNIDRSFLIAFRTPINDDTGMPHVFEHATLAGSGKYPGGNTWFDLIDKTSNTYLNGHTHQNLTTYPMSSTSEEQLLKYIDYYISGITDPLAIKNKFAMMREAYRYELDDPEGDISLQGIVYSEMLGYMNQDNTAEFNYNRMIWPDSYVSTNPGGDPRNIPDLTIDGLRNFHETYYHPSNASMYLTGDVDLPRFLDLLDSEFLSKYDKKEIVIQDSNYKPLEPGYYEKTFPFAAEMGTPTEKNAIIKYGMPFVISDYNDMKVLDYVGTYMNDESSPLQRIAKEKLPEAEISMETTWEAEGKDALVFNCSAIDAADKDTFKAVCDEALAELLENGVNEEVLNAILISKRFFELMKLDSSDIYLNLSEDMALEWSNLGDRDVWKKYVEFENHISELVTVENLNETARKYWTKLDTAVMAITVPEPGLKEKNDAALREKLDKMKADMTPEEVDALAAETRAYMDFVEESNAIPMPEELNALTVETLPEEIYYDPASETNIGGIRVVTNEIDSPLIRISIRTDTSSIPFEDLFDFSEYIYLLGTLGTEKYTREELPAKKAAVSVGMNMYNNHIEKPEIRDINNIFLTVWFALPETLEESFDLVEEILYNTDFSDYDYIRSDAASNYALSQMYMDSNGPSYGALAARAVFSPAGKLNYYLNSEAQMDYWDKLSKYTDEEMDALVEKFEGFRDIILNKNGALLTVMGNTENIMRSAALGYNLISKFDDTVLESVDYNARIEDLPLHTAIVTGGNVAFNFAAADLEAAGYEKYDGGLKVVTKIIQNKLFYPEIRVKNSAYGTYATLLTDYVLGYYSYRDPKVAETFDVYAKTGDFLRNLNMSESELEGYITSVYGELTMPVGPLSAALRGINDLVVGENTYEKTVKMIKDIKAFRTDDIVKYAPLADTVVSDSGSRVTAGAKSMIEANAELYDYINYNLMRGEEKAEETTGDDLIAVISELTPEEIEAMAANMDEEDLRSVVSYVIDYFTDENGKVDETKVFKLVGAFMNDKWSDAEISEAVEELEPNEGETVQDEEAVSKWESVFDNLFSELNEESWANWLEKVNSNSGESSETGEQVSLQESLKNLLEGIFGAFVKETNE